MKGMMGARFWMVVVIVEENSDWFGGRWMGLGAVLSEVEAAVYLRYKLEFDFRGPLQVDCADESRI